MRHVHPHDPDNNVIDWEGYLPTDTGTGWDGVRSSPPPEAAEEEWERWHIVRDALRYNNALALPVDRVRRIQKCIRPDGQMTSVQGEFDPLTVIAVMWFQRDHEVPITGVIDGPTLVVLCQEWPELYRPTSPDPHKPTVLVTDDRGGLHRFLYYRRMILDNGGLFDDRHREVNVLMLRGAVLRQGVNGLVLRYAGTGMLHASDPWVTVSLWVEREGGEDDGEVIGAAVRERPGHSRPVLFRRSANIQLTNGQYLCDIDQQGPTAPDPQALVRQYVTAVGAMPFRPAPLLPADGVDPSDVVHPVDPERLTQEHFFAELVAMRTERDWRDGWQGVRVMLLDASRLHPANSDPPVPLVDLDPT
jgi:hypothetical protein